MAVKDSIGGWKDNAYLYKAQKACHTMKLLAGNAWTPFMNDLGFTINATCFLPAV